MMQLHVELVGLGSSSSMDSFASWKMNGSGMKKEDREEMPLQGEDESRRSSPPQEAMDKNLEEEGVNEGRGREEHEILCSKKALKSEV